MIKNIKKAKLRKIMIHKNQRWIHPNGSDAIMNALGTVISNHLKKSLNLIKQLNSIQTACKSPFFAAHDDASLHYQDSVLEAYHASSSRTVTVVEARQRYTVYSSVSFLQL